MATLARRVALAVILALVAVTSVSAAEKLTDRQRTAAQAWAANNALFVIYHEVSHLLVDQLRLPVLGKEEDAADAMASYTLLERHTHDADTAIADSAYGWLLSSKVYGDGSLDDSDFYNPHSLDKQRAFQIVCYMVGSNEKAFGQIADDYNMDSERQESCGYDYQLLKRSMENVLGPSWRRTKKGVDIDIIYTPASGNLKAAAAAFKESGVFEQVAKELDAKYALRNKVSFRAKSCDQPNAFYDPQSVEVTFCYELMDDYLAMIADDMPEDTVPPTPTGLGRSETTEGF